MTTRRKVRHSPKPPAAPKKPAPTKPKKPAPPPVVEPPTTIDQPPDAVDGPPDPIEDTGDAGISVGVLGGGVTPDLPTPPPSAGRLAQEAIDRVTEQAARTREAAVRHKLRNPHLP